ncbi:hypothetical protein V8C26DRAFT_414149 [Trichoderma gracile]
MQLPLLALLPSQVRVALAGDLNAIKSGEPHPAVVEGSPPLIIDGLWRFWLARPASHPMRAAPPKPRIQAWELELATARALANRGSGVVLLHVLSCQELQHTFAAILSVTNDHNGKMSGD